MTLEEFIKNTIAACAKEFDVTVEEVMSRSRVEDVAKARQFAMWIATQYRQEPHRMMQPMFRRDRSTMSYAHRKVFGDMSVYSVLAKRMKSILFNLDLL